MEQKSNTSSDAARSRTGETFLSQKYTQRMGSCEEKMTYSGHTMEKREAHEDEGVPMPRRVSAEARLGA